MKQQLSRVRDWAHKKVRSGEEPPWSWYQYMKLIEASETILDGLDAARTERAPQSRRLSPESSRVEPENGRKAGANASSLESNE